MRFESVLKTELETLQAAELLREPDDGAARVYAAASAAGLRLPMLDATSNDYLGLAVSRETSGRTGAGASRLIYGTSNEHLFLESALAAWLGTESALLFSSTYSANLGLVSALGIEGSVIVSDAANHASLIDGARLARAKVVVVPHLNLEAVRSALADHRNVSACWVVTESYFSMDGDGPDLRALRSICDAYDACLIVDEAHALGVFGPAGAGRCAELGVRADVLVGAFGKALGSYGGFVAGSRLLRRYLWNRARSFIFSTASSPVHAELTLRQLGAARAADGLRAALAANAQDLRRLLRDAGLNLVPGSFGPIVSVIIGESRHATDVAARLQAAGILAHAVRPPTVPLGSSRLRLTVKASFGKDDLQRLSLAVEQACRAS